MIELEFKFRVPPESLEALRRRMAEYGVAHESLQTFFFDTPEETLARRGASLRLRCEAGTWYQTLKAPGVMTGHRLEHSVPLVHSGDRAPTVGWSRHAGSDAHAALGEVIPSDGQELSWVCQYGTELQCSICELSTRDARITVSLDEGFVVAGERRSPLVELELELMGGSVSSLVNIALEWIGRFRLALTFATKAERGRALATGASLCQKDPTSHISSPRNPEEAKAAMAAILDSFLQVVGVVSDGDGQPEDVALLRVRLGRLCSVLEKPSPANGPMDFEIPAELRDLTKEVLAALPGDKPCSCSGDRSRLELTLRFAEHLVRSFRFQRMLLALMRIILVNDMGRHPDPLLNF